MNSILNEIIKLRKGNSFSIDYSNSNRYRIVAMETNGSKTAYYFSTPIYNVRTRKAIDLQFNTNNKTIYASGSNANITVTNNIKIENSYGFCTISLSEPPKYISCFDIACGSERIVRTTNGVGIRSFIHGKNGYTFTIESNIPFLDMRTNDKYFALMVEKFRPFVTISSIGALANNGNVVSPAKISYQKINDHKFTITVLPCSYNCESIFIEVNLYEPKLFQDTTVESKNPKTNNAFGSIGFIGDTQEFGEQWLYAKFDYTKITELKDKKIQYAVLHIPKLNNNSVELILSKTANRFCSFGSTWNNKISESKNFSDSLISDNYINFNLLPIIADSNGRLSHCEGFICKAKKKGSGFSVIPTADSYLFPQILEVNYK